MYYDKLNLKKAFIKLIGKEKGKNEDGIADTKFKLKIRGKKVLKKSKIFIKIIINIFNFWDKITLYTINVLKNN